MYNPYVIKELFDEAIKEGNRAKAYKYAQMLDKITKDFNYRSQCINKINVEYAEEGEYIVNIRFPQKIEYIPILKTNRKNRVIKYINSFYEENDKLQFRVDESNNITFINCRNDLDYFEGRVRLKK